MSTLAPEKPKKSAEESDAQQVIKEVTEPYVPPENELPEDIDTGDKFADAATAVLRKIFFIK